MINPSPNSALIVVDVQNDFASPSGSLYVQEGEMIVVGINNLMLRFNTVVLTQDWHPRDHVSFKTWPEHCIANSVGSQFHHYLRVDRAHMIMRKGTNPDVDSYSAFMDEQYNKSGLGGFLKERNIDTVYCCGLALDYCVKATALDAQKLGFKTYIVRDLCKAVNPKAVTVIEGIEMIER